MALLKNLPAELVIAIAGLTRRKDILHLASTCHQLHQILDSQLFRSIDITVGPQPKCKEHSFRRLVHSVVSRPIIGTYVRTMNLIFNPNCGPFHEDELYPLSRDMNLSVPVKTLWELYGWSPSKEERKEMQVLLKACKQKNMASGLLAVGRSWGELILLLHYLPGLRDLHMNTNSFVSIVGFAALGKLKGGVPAGLGSLQSLTLTNKVYVEHMRLYDLEDARCCQDREGSDDGDGYTFSDYYYDMLAGCFEKPTLPAESIVPFMVLPSLANLSVSNFAADKSDTMPMIECSDSHPAPPQKLLPGCSSVATLSLTDSKLDRTFLHRMLGLFRGLNTLNYEVDAKYNDATVIFSDVVRDLVPNASTLHDLNLYTKYDVMEHSQIKPFTEPQFHLLASFTALLRLRINAMDLLGRPPTDNEPTLPINPLHSLLLPSSLESIELDLCGVRGVNWNWKQILQVLDVNSTSIVTLHRKMPNLRRIHLWQAMNYTSSRGRVLKREKVDMSSFSHAIDLEVQIIHIQ